MGQNLNQIRPDTAAGSVPMTMAPRFRMEYVRPQTLADTLAPYLPSGHSPVTLSGTPDYISLSGQDIVRGLIDLTTDVTGLLPGTNINSITESQISDLDHFTAADITGSETAFNGWDKDAANDVTELSDLTDVNTSTPTNGNVLIADGVDWESRALTEADISDFGTYLTAEVDGSITNEGSLTVGAGTSTTSLISSNTSGSTDVTLTAGTGLSIAEAGNVITLANTGVLTTAGDWTGTLDGFEGSALNQNFANTDLSTLNSRSHNWNSQDLTIFGLDQLSLLTSTSLQWIVLNTTGVDLQGTTHNFGATTSIVLDAPDIILEDPLTLSTWDSILVRHPVTGEIQGRLASTIAGSDSLGRNGTPGQIVFETATKAPNSSANLFWSGSGLGVGTSTVTGKIHIVGASTLELLMESTSGNPDMAFAESGNVKAQWKYDITGHRLAAYVDESNSGLVGITTPDFSIYDNGTVVIGTGAIAASAALDIQSTVGGLLPPRMTGTQRDAISSPADGLILYNSTTSKLQVRAGGAWVDLH